MSEKRLSYLFNRYFDKTASEEEQAELMILLQKAENDEQTRTLLKEAWERLSVDAPVFSSAQSTAILDKILQPSPVETPVYELIPRSHTIPIRRIAVAAVVLLVLATTAYLGLFNKGPKKEVAIVKQKEAPVSIDVPAPNGNNAILTLADGSKVVLDSTHNGAIAQQGDAQVSKAGGGKLVYNALEANPTRIVYNEVSTRRGGQFQIVLPDGSKVWLNTISSIRFPTAFAGDKREVELTGEAYFEIEKNAAMPFHVKVNNIDVTVLGTSFNVMGYDNEREVRTTLLDGAVKVAEGTRSMTLTPGQQVKVDKRGGFVLDKDADIELAIAWKNGVTSFKSADIESIMRQVERWYDIDVVYEGQIPERTFSGAIGRNANLAELVKILEINKINFKMEGRKLTVMP
jgi:ferric-dicitrate binding protein FerR (iron transport regulator)